MNEFLSDYILSVGSRSKKKFENVLQSAKASKEDVNNIVERLSSIKQGSPILYKPQPFGGVIDNVTLDSIYRDTRLKFRELYAESNSVSEVLNTHAETLASEISKQFDQVNAFEKYVDNYSFLLADRSFYDSAYTESFSDDIQQEKTELLNTMLYDRSGVDFNRSNEILEVDNQAGILTTSAFFTKNYLLSGSIKSSNCLGNITSDTGIDKSVTENPGEGWRVAISSPRPINSSIYEGDKKGVQFEIEYSLDNPSPCDTVSVTPLSNTPAELISLKIYEDVENNKSEELITSVISLDKIKNFYFDQKQVAKIVMIINQPVYSRGKLPPNVSEANYKEVLEAQRLESNLRPETKKASKAAQRLFPKWVKGFDQKRVQLKKPVTNFSKYSGKLDSKDYLSYQKNSAQVYSLFKFKQRKQNIFDQWIVEKIFGNQPGLLDRFTRNVRPETMSSEIPFLASTKNFENNESTSFQNYEYSVGIKNVKIGITTNAYRGVFISRPVPSPVQVGEVKIKVKQENFDFQNSFLDNPQVTNIEYSVSNSANPTSEKDWVPIIPVNSLSEEVTERAFPQSSGFIKLRMNASNELGVLLFKNGERVELEDTSIVRSDDRLSIIGLRVPFSELSLEPDTFYTVRYLPISDPTVVNFQDHGFSKRNLASAFDDNGAGESYGVTGGSKSITLRNIPYVDFKNLESLSSYSSNLGLVGTYQPITIILEDGTVVPNFTNYFGLTQIKLNDESLSYSFLHSGREIIFNKDVDQPFRVFYQYEPSYLRYRVIFRVNSLVKVSPSVDSISIKMKMNSSILGNNEKKV